MLHAQRCEVTPVPESRLVDGSSSCHSDGNFFGTTTGGGPDVGRNNLQNENGGNTSTRRRLFRPENRQRERRGCTVTVRE